ncbi:hypothetical protein KFE25_013919 [Diacronema lutheri]|uniref:Uncharacterized protein n=2 Tax=Diacronema lutheri TaxID=2081491 RepID=A0A8J6C9S5_DIALT|nr:hypothetical protein KFE25_013919 [Diacronema lutheri]
MAASCAFWRASRAAAAVREKHATLALCFQPAGHKRPGVQVTACCSIGTEALPSLRHRLVLFALVTASTLALAAAVRLGLESRLAAYGIACCVVFPVSLLLRSFLAHHSLRLASACGQPYVRAEEWALLGLCAWVVFWLSAHSSRQEAAETLVVAAHAWFTMQLLEALFILALCACCGCCSMLGCRRSPTQTAPASGERDEEFAFAARGAHAATQSGQAEMRPHGLGGCDASGAEMH